MPHALIIEDDPNSLRGLSHIAQADGFTVDLADNLTRARAALARSVPDVVLVDVDLPDGIGLDLLPELPQLAPRQRVPVVVMTGNATLESAQHSLRLGAWDYLVKPVDVARLRSLLGRVPRSADLHAEVARLRGALRAMGHFGEMVGRSPQMQRIYDTIIEIAPGEANLLIGGDSGTGKEVAARTVHQLSYRRNGPFVILNCADSAPAVSLADGFEQAAGGTLLLDDITRLPLARQAQLLQMLDTRSYTPPGASAALPTDVRLIAIADRDAQQAVQAHTLRLDLYQLLSTCTLIMPPLRHRDDDVLLLAHYFVEQLNQAQQQKKRLAPACDALLMHQPWPGNVRELRNQIERGYLASDGLIEPAHFENAACAGDGAHKDTMFAHGAEVMVRVGTHLADAERQLIEAAMKSASGVRSKAAMMLGISPKTLYNKLKQFEANR